MGQLALPGVPDRGLALPLCGVDQEEGFHSWLENWGQGDKRYTNKKQNLHGTIGIFMSKKALVYMSLVYPILRADHVTPPALSGTPQACPTARPIEAAR